MKVGWKVRHTIGEQLTDYITWQNTHKVIIILMALLGVWHDRQVPIHRAYLEHVSTSSQGAVYTERELLLDTCYTVLGPHQYVAQDGVYIPVMKYLRVWQHNAKGVASGCLLMAWQLKHIVLHVASDGYTVRLAASSDLMPSSGMPCQTRLQAWNTTCNSILMSLQSELNSTPSRIVTHSQCFYK